MQPNTNKSGNGILETVETSTRTLVPEVGTTSPPVASGANHTVGFESPLANGGTGFDGATGVSPVPSPSLLHVGHRSVPGRVGYPSTRGNCCGAAGVLPAAALWLGRRLLCRACSACFLRRPWLMFLTRECIPGRIVSRPTRGDPLPLTITTG